MFVGSCFDSFIEFKIFQQTTTIKIPKKKKIDFHIEKKNVKFYNNIKCKLTANKLQLKIRLNTNKIFKKRMR